MKKTVIILYALFCMTYVACCFYFFPELNSNIMILSIPLLALGVWLFGTSIGLLLSLFFIFITFLLSQIYGNEYTYYMDRATGPLLALSVTYLIGKLQTNFHRIRRLNQELDKRVHERTAELRTLTERLINHAEAQRMTQGQELHDGIGQQLTGIQLLGSSLAQQLKIENHDLQQSAKSLTDSSNSVHHHIRKIARMLFPIRIAKVGLTAALDELIHSLIEIRPARIQLNNFSDSHNPPTEEEALQLYRICHESCSLLIDYCKADQLEIRITTAPEKYTLNIVHNAAIPLSHCPNYLPRLIQYRLNKIGGSQAISTTIDKRTMITFNLPANYNSSST